MKRKQWATFVGSMGILGLSGSITLSYFLLTGVGTIAVSIWHSGSVFGSFARVEMAIGAFHYLCFVFMTPLLLYGSIRAVTWALRHNQETSTLRKNLPAVPAIIAIGLPLIVAFLNVAGRTALGVVTATIVTFGFAGVGAVISMKLLGMSVAIASEALTDGSDSRALPHSLLVLVGFYILSVGLAFELLLIFFIT